jgi:hypothetical protein
MYKGERSIQVVDLLHAPLKFWSAMSIRERRVETIVEI